MSVRNFGSEEGGGFNEISKAYKASPSIENYLKLRKENPQGEIEISIGGGIETLFFMQKELSRYGIDVKLMAGVLDADQGAISTVSLHMLSSLANRDELRRSGRTHLARRRAAIPDKLIDWFINTALGAMSWTDEMQINRDLIVLIRERLGGSKTFYEEASKSNELKRNASVIAGQLLAQGLPSSIRATAKILGVAPSTVKRWFEPGEFEKERDFWAALCDENGQLSPLKAR